MAKKTIVGGPTLAAIETAKRLEENAMGESRFNPRSTQYKGDHPVSPLPEFKLLGDIGADMVPNEAFLDRAKLANEEAERAGAPPPRMTVTEADIDVVISARVAFMVPMRTTDKAPTAVIPVMPIARVPLSKVKEQAHALFRRDGHNADALVKLPEALVTAE